MAPPRRAWRPTEPPDVPEGRVGEHAPISGACMRDTLHTLEHALNHNPAPEVDPLCYKNRAPFCSTFICLAERSMTP